ncbi:vomeronasal type-1 receptor 1-like [Sarcophilus harrisii]|uniref:vomeronasal type-1 receptor 1-like n=1 Tax=Sarcophilus harrisii TaxID=9305 RepID=UPI000273A5EB|nr:vomeronasal type-1 receptor 1-like [Sarcophilus harrisii]
MFPTNMCFGIIMLFQTGLGVPTNIFLLCFFSLNFFSGHRKKPVNLIFIQMNFVNLMMFFSKVFLDIPIYLGMRNFLNDVDCKLVTYIHRLCIALSVCFTCYLCTFQAVIISSSISRLGKFKAWFLDHIIYFCLFFWILNLLLEIPVLFSVTGPRYMNNTPDELNFGNCSLETHNNVYWGIITIRNVICVVVIVLVSCYIVYLLYRHHQKVQAIHSSSVSARTFPEVRATRTILLLVSTFVFFYSFISICTICINYFYQHRFWLLPMATILCLCFPTLSPFILIPWGSRKSFGLLTGIHSKLSAIQLPK